MDSVESGRPSDKQVLFEQEYSKRMFCRKHRLTLLLDIHGQDGLSASEIAKTRGILLNTAWVELESLAEMGMLDRRESQVGNRSAERYYRNPDNPIWESMAEFGERVGRPVDECDQPA